MRLRVKMKDKIDPKVLYRSVNEAIKRYPYFAVKPAIDKDGGIILLPNDARIKVFPARGRQRELGSDEVNGHLCFIEYDKKTYILISVTVSAAARVLSHGS